MSGKRQHIAILTCCMDDWGGSEELWARAIPFLRQQNVEITLYKDHINYDHPEIDHLRNQGLHFVELAPPQSLLQRAGQKIYRKLFEAQQVPIQSNSPHAATFKKEIAKQRPELVVIAQGINFDGLGYAYQCLQLDIPYCIIAQKAVEFFWPPTAERLIMKETFQNAKQCFFVSGQNQQLTEEQFGFRFENARLVWNPVKINREPVPYPDTSTGLRLACVGRLFIIDKGQDILLRILSREPWKSRPVTVSFVGTGHDEAGIKALSDLLGVANVTYPGHQKDIRALWSDFHALVLPSRSEGMALSVLEAMAAGRTVITTHAGGHASIIEHGKTGFIAAATEGDFARAMEDAYQLRNDWAAIGLAANQQLNAVLPDCPEKDFSELLLNLIVDEA